jgi:hypothetical protein
VIEGPAGIGKTSLLGSVRELARQARMNVRAARGAELEQGFAFGVVRQLFDPLLAAASEADRSQWLAGGAELAAPLFGARGSLVDAHATSAPAAVTAARRGTGLRLAHAHEHRH